MHTKTLVPLILGLLGFASPSAAATLSLTSQDRMPYNVRLMPQGPACKTPCTLEAPDGYNEASVSGPGSFQTGLYFEKGKSYEGHVHSRPGYQTAVFWTLLISGATIFSLGTATTVGGLLLFGIVGAVVGLVVGGGLLVATWLYARYMDPPSGIDVAEARTAPSTLSSNLVPLKRF